MHRPPFRADHIGSLLRPPRCARPFAPSTIGGSTRPALPPRRMRRSAMPSRLQAVPGLRCHRRRVPPRLVLEPLRGAHRGLERRRSSRFTFRDGGLLTCVTAPLVTGKVARRQPIALDEFCFLRDDATALPKVTLPAPSTMHFWRGTGYAVPGVYDQPGEFFRDLPRSIAPRSPRWPPPAAATSSSTKSRLPCCATRSCANG